MWEKIGRSCGWIGRAMIGILLLPFLVVYVVIPCGLLLMTAGAAWGGGQAVVNYCRALRANVSLERPWID